MNWLEEWLYYQELKTQQEKEQEYFENQTYMRNE
jgi:hypothetical protein